MPIAYGGEGASRPRRDGETDSEARNSDALYTPFERLSKERDYLSELHALRCRFVALFGNAAEEPFQVLVRTYNQIQVATRSLINDRPQLGEAMRDRFEKLIGWTGEDDDPVRADLDQAVEAMEAICRPVLQEPAR